jgi:hypothetical protein
MTEANSGNLKEEKTEMAKETRPKAKPMAIKIS